MNNKLIEVLIDLQEQITQIKDIMETVSTGGCSGSRKDFWKCIEKFDSEYQELRVAINLKIKCLEEYGLSLVQKNTFRSLKDFYDYWSRELPTYKERRRYIRDLYKDLENKIDEALIDLNNEKYDVIINEEPFFEILNVLDDFYRNLIDLLNECYSKELYLPAILLYRKLLESLIIDLFKKKYSDRAVEKYYNPHQGRYLTFNSLINNLRENLSDFKHYSNSLNKEFIESINKYREKGNVAAHVLEIDMRKTKSDFEKEKDNMNHIVKVLMRILSLQN
mgnify:CR=1 FL=1